MGSRSHIDPPSFRTRTFAPPFRLPPHLTSQPGTRLESCSRCTSFLGLYELRAIHATFSRLPLISLKVFSIFFFLNEKTSKLLMTLFWHTVKKGILRASKCLYFQKCFLIEESGEGRITFNLKRFNPLYLQWQSETIFRFIFSIYLNSISDEISHRRTRKYRTAYIDSKSRDHVES